MHHGGDSVLHLDYLKCLNTAQLLELLEDEEQIRETFRSNSKKSKKILIASNCWLAEKNLAFQPHLTSSKRLLAEKYQTLAHIVSSMRHKEKKIENLQRKLNLRAIHRILKGKINLTSSQSETLWQTFTDG
ncbi:hypothetical protein DNTS_010816, partial [Danionella cerebrum]